MFSGWLAVSRLCDKDAILVFSVGGGDAERNVSTNIVKAVDFAKSRSAAVLGVVGRSSGYTATFGDIVVVIPEVAPALLNSTVRSLSGGDMALLSEPPMLQLQKTKW